VNLFSSPNSEFPFVEPGAARQDDAHFASAKLAGFQYTAVAIFIFLISGFWQLQIRRQDTFRELALQNSIKSLPIIAPRGKILDRDGRVIVDNHSTWRLLLSRETLKMEHIDGIAQGLGMDPNEIREKLARFARRPKYEPLIVKEELTPAELAFVESHSGTSFYPEMEKIEAERRLYPQNGMAAHVIGYTGEISELDMDNPEYAKYESGAIVGKFGIERQYNDVLTGIDGQRQVTVDNMGRERRVLGFKEATPGKNLKLTLDLDLQAVAELALEGKRGSIVALDPRTGEVLAMVSRPAFDPNKFRVHISTKDWRELMDDPGKPMLNRAIQAQLAPGSTFKPLMALAGLESGTMDPNWSVHCSGGASFYGQYHACWQKRGHGQISMHNAIVHSCDVYFYNVGNKMGVDKIAYYAQQAGLGHKSGIDLPSEADGTVPSTAWKARLYRQKWYPGETISVAIGQGALTVSPLQLARMTAGIAMGGVWHTPHMLISETRNEKPHRLAVNPENVELVKAGMWGVVNEAGTGASARVPGLEICGKTGSAQVASNKVAKGNKALNDNAWFVSFAPRDNPEIAVAVLFEGAMHGNLTAPSARDVIKAYFDKKQAQHYTEQQKPAVPAITPAYFQNLLARP
jgi:penicillin-binding protein 2